MLTGRTLVPETAKVTPLGKLREALLAAMVISAGFFSATGVGEGVGATVEVTDGDREMVGERADAGTVLTVGVDKDIVEEGAAAIVETGGGEAGVEGADATVDGPQAVSPSTAVSTVIRPKECIKCLIFIIHHSGILMRGYRNIPPNIDSGR